MLSIPFQNYISGNRKFEIQDSTAFFEVPVANIVQVVCSLYENKDLQLKIITATDERKENDCFKIFYVFGIPKEHAFLVPFIRISGKEGFPSVASEIHEAWNYERKIRTFFGLNPVGHPDQRPVILHENWPQAKYPLRKDFSFKERPQDAKGDSYAFERVEGEGVYEIPVGPIHAGIIEPGHFRFNVAGEEILLLEAHLGYTHKGIEKLFEVLPVEDKVKLSERISGDSSFSYSLAFCRAVEKLSGIKVSSRAQYLRVVFAELERLANHMGDIGFIMADTGFNFGGANGSRLREMILRINERLTGSRFLRGVNSIGGVTKDITEKEGDRLVEELKAIEKDFLEVIHIAENSESLLNRLKNTGILTPQVANDHGALGVPRRALGGMCDARVDYPYEAYENFGMEVQTAQGGDVYARFTVRVKEAHASLELIKQALSGMPEGATGNPTQVFMEKNAVVVSVVEGWRGDIVYVVMTDSVGAISRVDVRDPSFLNWAALGHAGPGNIVPDFPLINKSFSLSYSGNDL